MAKVKNRLTGQSGTGDAERGFQILRKPRNHFGDHLGLLAQRIQQPLGIFRAAADQFHGGRNEGKFVVHIVAQSGKSPV